jgi:hypothetical protein
LSLGREQQLCSAPTLPTPPKISWFERSAAGSLPIRRKRKRQVGFAQSARAMRPVRRYKRARHNNSSRCQRRIVQGAGVGLKQRRLVSTQTKQRRLVSTQTKHMVARGKLGPRPSTSYILATIHVGLVVDSNADSDVDSVVDSVNIF